MASEADKKRKETEKRCGDEERPPRLVAINDFNCHMADSVRYQSNCFLVEILNSRISILVTSRRQLTPFYTVNLK